MFTSVKYFIPLLLLLMLAGCTIVTGSGNIVSESREVSGFDEVVLAGSGNLTITQGDGEALTVEADDNLMDLIETEVRNGVLYLGFKSGANIINTSRAVQYQLTVDDLSELTISGSGNVSAESLVSDDFSLNVSGSGEAQIDRLTASEISIEISGSGDVDIVGAVEEQSITVSGSGNYRAGDLVSENVTVRISGSGNATVWVAEMLDVVVSGSGNVEYYGTPRVNQQVSGSGNIRSLGNK